MTSAELEIVATANTADAERGIKSLDSSVKAAGPSMQDYQKAGFGLMGVGAAIAGGFGLAIATTAGFEKQISAIGAVSGATGAELDQVRELALRLGADTSFSATEAASGLEELLKAGVPIEDVLNGAGQAALDMAAATGTAVPLAANMMSAALNVFGADATHAATVFSQAANASAADASDLAQGFAMSATVAKQFGMSLDDNVTALALFSQAGLQGSDAGTSFKTMLLSMLDPTEEQSSLMSELGLSFFDAQGNFIGLEGTAEQLQTKLAGLTQEQRNTALATLFGSDAVRAAAILYEEGAEGVGLMRDEMAKQGDVSEMAKKRLDNFSGALEQFKGSIETAMIIVGSGFTPVLKKLAEFMSAAVGKFLDAPPILQKIVIGAVALAGGLAFLAGAAYFASSASGVLTAGLGMLLSPIVLIVGAIALLGAALYFAYTENFLGFADGVQRVIDALGIFKPAIEDIKDVFQAIAEGNFGEAWDEIKEAITSFGEAFDLIGPAILEGLAGIWDWIAGFDWAGLIGSVWNALSGAVSGIDWGGVFSAIGEAIALPATLLGDFLTSIETGFAPIDGILQGAGEVWQGFASVIRSVFSGDLSGVIDGFMQMFRGIGTELQGFGSLIVTAFEAINWGGIATTLAGKGRELIGGIGTGIDEAWVIVTGWLGTIGTLALEALGELGEVLAEEGGELIGGLKTGAEGKWAEVWGWINNRPAVILEAIGELSRTLHEKGLDLIAGLWDGVLDKWAELKGWLMPLGGYITAAVGDLSRFLHGRGVEVISGLYDGILDKWAGLKSWIKGLGGYIKDAASGLNLGTLWGEGWNVISGLASGIRSAADSLVSSAISYVTDKIPGWVRSRLGIDSPSKVMMPLGAFVTAGLASGIRQEAGRSLLSALGYTSSIISGYGMPAIGANVTTGNGAGRMAGSPMFATGSGGGATYYVTNHIRVDLEGLEELTQAADFVSSLSRERQLVTGGAF